MISDYVAATYWRAWRLRAFEQVPKYWLTFDFGGSKLTVAIVKISFNKIETVAVDGDNNLGGRDFDRLLMDDLIEKFI